MEWVFAQLDARVEAWPDQRAIVAFVAELAEDLRELTVKGEDACQFAARLLVRREEFLKRKAAFEADCAEAEA